MKFLSIRILAFEVVKSAQHRLDARWRSVALLVGRSMLVVARL
jgi:hypothetical protein